MLVARRFAEISCLLLLTTCFSAHIDWARVGGPEPSAEEGPGSVDDTFGVGGGILNGFGAGDSEIRGVAVYPSTAGEFADRFVAVGHATLPTSGRTAFAVARYLADGTLDTSFAALSSTPGVSLVSISTGNSRAFAVHVQNDGSALVAGDVEIAGQSSLALRRYTPTGEVDGAFGDVIHRIGATNTFGTSLFVDDNGIIFVGGYTVVGVRSAAYAAFSQTGGLALDWLGDGDKVDSGTPWEVHAMADDGNFLLSAGASGMNNQNKYVFNRMDKETAGQQQREQQLKLTASAIYGFVELEGATAYGAGGEAVAADGTSRFFWVRNDHATLAQSADLHETLTLIGDSASARALKMHEGKVILGGFARSGDRHYFAVARYLADGNLDTDFNGNGKMTVSLGTDDKAQAMALQSDGKIILAGYATVGGVKQFAVTRVSP